jgi:hypothetical protein
MIEARATPNVQGHRTHDVIVRLELVWFTLDALAGETVAIDEGSIGRLDILDEDRLEEERGSVRSIVRTGLLSLCS